MQTITDQASLLKFFADAGTDVVHATVITRTPVTMRKKDIKTKMHENPYSVAYKVQTMKVLLNADYAEKVNEQREREGVEEKFDATKMRWGEKVNGFVNKQGAQLYLRTIVVDREGSPAYEDADGNTIHYDILKPFLPPEQPAYRQGVDDAVTVRVIKLDNIVGINVNEKLRYVKC